MKEERNRGPWRGLTLEEVAASRERHGVNLLAPPERQPWWRQLGEKFDDPVIRILLVAAGIAIFTGEWLEGAGIIVAVLLATGLAFANEFKAEREFDVLNRVHDDIPVKAVRDGRLCQVARKDIVVGDVVLVETGDEIPGDGRVLEAVNLQVDQSRLTGESDPVAKHPAAEDAASSGEAAYPEWQVLRGTPAVDGYGYIEITAVGSATEIGRTATAAAIDTGEKTPLARQLEKLGNLIGVIGFGVALSTFAALVVRAVLIGEIHQDAAQWLIFGILALAVFAALMRVWLPVVLDGVALWRGRRLRLTGIWGGGARGWIFALGCGIGIAAAGLGVLWLTGVLPASEWAAPGVFSRIVGFFMVAVTLIVVAVPEGLAMSVTLSLAYSVRRMTADNNLVRKMHACETIGAATVICTDKTGTLTMNRMEVMAVEFPRLQSGGEREGRRVALAMAANSTANLAAGEAGEIVPLGNPTEGALLLWLRREGYDYEALRGEFAITRRWTFSTERKFMATAGRDGKGEAGEILLAKGAPEFLLERSVFCETGGGGDDALTESHRALIVAELRRYQARGMRTLGFAWRREPAAGEELDQVARDLVWMGFVAIADPVRSDVPDAVAECRRAGIAVKMVTGDTTETAREIARQVHLWESEAPGEGAILTGAEFQALDDAEAEAAARRLLVMARARPADKLKLVRALKRSGEVVAVTGDGTNDAPALNYSDVGIAMGKTGTAIAREAADIILLDDSFNSIVNAVMWGRSLYRNIQRFIVFQLTVNVVALSIAVLGPFIGIAMPLTVIQMLWVNLIMDTFAALALATEPPDPAVMERPPRRNDAFIVTPAMWRAILGTAAVFLAVLIGFLLLMKGYGVAEERRWQSIFFSVFVMLQFWNLFNAKCLDGGSTIFRHILNNRAFLGIAAGILAGQVVMVQLGGNLFRTAPLAWDEWLAIIVGTSAILWGGEIIRTIWRVFRRRRP